MRGASIVFVVAVGFGGIAACVGNDPNLDSDGKPDDAGRGSDSDQSTKNDDDASPDGPDGGPSPDPDSGSDSDADGGGKGGPGFAVVSPNIELEAGQQISTCYYFHTTNATPLAIKSWSSKLGQGVDHMALVFTDTDKAAPGTLSTADCEIFGTGGSWVYSAWTPTAGWSFPADDGSGKPLGKPVKANQSAYLVIQMTNGTSAKLTSKVELDAVAYDPGTTVTAAEPYVAQNADINVAANTNNVVVSRTCSVPAGAKLTWMTMFAHRRASQLTIKGGGTTVFDTSNFANPGSKAFSAPFYAFPNDKAEYSCTYNNPTTQPFSAGPSPKSDEACAMLGYHFPASKPRLCVTSTLLP